MIESGTLFVFTLGWMVGIATYELVRQYVKGLPGGGTD